jgi:hypothetical protein
MTALHRPPRCHPRRLRGKPLSVDCRPPQARMPNSFTPSGAYKTFAIPTAGIPHTNHMITEPAPKTCPICLQVFRMPPIKNPKRTSQERHAFRKRTYCSHACQSTAARQPPKTRAIAGKQARILKPFQPCERCGSHRRSQVHHKDRNPMNNALDNLERLCHWCHAAEHAPEIKARAAQGWITRRQRYGQNGHP